MWNSKRVHYSIVLATVAFLLLLPLWWGNIYWIQILCFVWINILLTSSLRVISLTGELSLGTGGFMLVGAYGSALVSMHWGISVWLCIMIGGMITALVAFVLGIAIVRTKDVYFSILTLLTSEIFRLTMWYWKSLSGGPEGLSNIPSPSPINVFGIAIITFDSQITYYYMILFVVILCLFIMYRLERTLGLTLMALKKSEPLSESIGINGFSYKLIVFVISCFFTGIAGALFAHYMQLLDVGASGKFGMIASIYILIYMVVGGEGSFAGPILGAFVLTILPELARPLREYQPIIFGLLVILIMFFMRHGLVSLPDQFRSWWVRIENRRKIKEMENVGRK